MDVILSKIESIKKCINRVNDEYSGNIKNLDNYTKQDAIVLNLQRACELSIDIANYLIAKYQFEVPKTSREAFEILYNHKILQSNITNKMQKMVGFRNIAIHDYKKIDIEILLYIVKNNQTDFEEYCTQVVEYIKNEGKRNP